MLRVCTILCGTEPYRKHVQNFIMAFTSQQFIQIIKENSFCKTKIKCLLTHLHIRLKQIFQCTGISVGFFFYYFIFFFIKSKVSSLFQTRN